MKSPDNWLGPLPRLPPVARAAFAAACAERLLAAYRWFHERTGQGDPDALEDALEALWTDLIGGRSTDLELQQRVAEGLVPSEDDSWMPESAFAQHAAAAVAYAIGSRLRDDAEQAAWAARQVYDALDLWIITRDDLDLNVAGVEERIASDPLVQKELARQRRDIEQLGDASEGEVPALAAQMRERAGAEVATLFGTAMWRDI